MADDKLYSIVMAALAVFIIGYLLLTSNWEVEFDRCFEYDTEEQIEICQAKNEICDNDYCYIQKAERFLDESACHKIDDENLRRECISEISVRYTSSQAVQKNNFFICSELEDETLVSKCVDNYYITIASNTGNSTYCQKISKEDLKNECETA